MVPYGSARAELAAADSDLRQSVPSLFKFLSAVISHRIPAVQSEKVRSCRITTEHKTCPYCQKDFGTNGFAKHCAACERRHHNASVEALLGEELLRLWLARHALGAPASFPQ